MCIQGALWIYLGTDFKLSDSVTRFDENLRLWQFCLSIRRKVEAILTKKLCYWPSIRRNFEPALAIFYATGQICFVINGQIWNKVSGHYFSS